MARSLFVPGVALLAVAAALGLLCTISLPTAHFFDVVRVKFTTHGTPIKGTVDSIRWGIWGYCYEATGDDHFSCKHEGLGYEIILGTLTGGSISTQPIGASYTRGLILHLIAFGATLIALALAISSSIAVSLVASLMSVLAAVLSLIAMAIDIALYVRVHVQANDLKDVKSNTDFGPAFWMTVASTILCIGAAGTVCFGRRKAATDSYSYPMLDKRPWYRRFGRD